VRDVAAVATFAAQHPGTTLLDVQAASQSLAAAQRTNAREPGGKVLLLIGVVIALRDAARRTRAGAVDTDDVRRDRGAAARGRRR
jgi:hypothetical protein